MEPIDLNSDVVNDLEALAQFLIDNSVPSGRGSGKTGMTIMFAKWAVEVLWIMQGLREQLEEKEENK